MAAELPPLALDDDVGELAGLQEEVEVCAQFLRADLAGGPGSDRGLAGLLHVLPVYRDLA